MTAAAVPGLAATGPTSQAAMLAAQNAGFGLTGLAKTAAAGAGAQGAGMGAQMGVGALNMADMGLDMMAGRGKMGMQGMNMAQGLMSPPQQQSAPPRPPPAPPAPPPPSGYGNRGGGLPPELAMLPPNDPRVLQYLKMRGM